MSNLLCFDGFEAPVKKREKSPKTPKPAKVSKPKRSANTIYEPLPQCLSIGPDRFCVYNDTSELRRAGRINKGNDVKRVLDTGTLSRGGQTKFKRSMLYLGMIAKQKTIYNEKKGYYFKAKLTLITLTLSDRQKHPDKFIKAEMLDKFLDSMRKMYSGFNYVWRAETQKETGNIHFHILTDHFIPYYYLNKVWNNIQYHYGYMNKYLKEKGSIHAPSVNVEKVKNDKALGCYMRKYMIKGLDTITIDKMNEKIQETRDKIEKSRDNQEIYDLSLLLRKQLIRLSGLKSEAQARKVKGKLWGCSVNLLLKPFITYVTGLNMKDREKIMSSEVIVNNDYFQVFKIDYWKKFTGGLTKFTKEMLDQHFSLLLKDKPIVPDWLFYVEKNYRY